MPRLVLLAEQTGQEYKLSRKCTDRKVADAGLSGGRERRTLWFVHVRNNGTMCGREFEAVPKSVLDDGPRQKQPCPDCQTRQRLTHEEFVARSRAKWAHPDTIAKCGGVHHQFDYPDAYNPETHGAKENTVLMTIVHHCPDGSKREFRQLAKSHMTAADDRIRLGCYVCSIRKE